MTQRSHSNALAGPGIMLLSAAIFGYFGFAMTWSYHSSRTGEFLLFVALLDWTLKCSSIAFLVSALLTFVKPIAGNLIYGLVGFVGAALFLLIAGLDFADKQHTAMHPLLLLIFAAWNGYGSFSGLREILNARRMALRIEPPTTRYNRPL